MQIGEDNFLTKKEDGYLDGQNRLFSFRGGEELARMYAKEQENLSACPYCDSDAGFYQRIRAEVLYHFKIDGTLLLNNQSLPIKNTVGDCRCLKCDQEITREIFKPKVIFDVDDNT